jgi:multidrug efflux pump subunit AcrA (membrane-fusion protein)
MAGVIFTLLIAAGIVLAVVPWEYRIDATGRLMPITQREVFAPWDGQVVELWIQDGQRVTKGDRLLQLRSDELAAERATVESELLEKRKLLVSLNVQRDEATQQGKREDALRLQGKAVETSVELEGAARQLEILKDRYDRLTVLAPITGVVTTFQIHQLLQNRPVQRGEVLLQVMDDQADWHLELEIPEHRLGRVLMEQQRRTTQSQPPVGAFVELPVTYRLLTQPDASYSARLTSLSTRAVAADPQGSVIEARASLENSLPQCTIGAEVRARVSCGPSYLGDVLFGDLIEFAQKYLWW